MADTEAKNVVADVGEKAASVVKAPVESVKNVVEYAKGSNVGIVVIGAVVAIVVCAVVGYGMYLLITRAMLKKVGHTIPQTKVPVVCTSVTKGSGEGIPRPKNGKRMTFSFWMYLDNLDYFHGAYRHVLHRGNELNGSGPMVVLDKKSNKLFIRFPNTDDAKISGGQITPQRPYLLNDDYKDEGDNMLYADLLTHGISIDYIPLQRWVHVAVIVNEEVKRGVIYAYVDGELVKTVSSDNSMRVKLANGNVANKRFDFTRIVLDTQGDIMIGGSPSDPTVGPGFDGLVSKVQFFNYDLNAKDIYDVYLQGPVDSMFARMGLPAYGVQSPIYRIN